MHICERNRKIYSRAVLNDDLTVAMTMVIVAITTNVI